MLSSGPTTVSPFGTRFRFPPLVRTRPASGRESEWGWQSMSLALYLNPHKRTKLMKTPTRPWKQPTNSQFKPVAERQALGRDCNPNISKLLQSLRHDIKFITLFRVRINTLLFKECCRALARTGVIYTLILSSLFTRDDQNNFTIILFNRKLKRLTDIVVFIILLMLLAAKDDNSSSDIDFIFLFQK